MHAQPVFLLAYGASVTMLSATKIGGRAMKIRQSIFLLMSAVPLPDMEPQHLVVSSDEYPRRSLQNGEQGNVEFKVDVNTRGKAENCVVISSSGYPALDKATCDMVTKRFRFTVAKDGKGNPVGSRYTNVIRWVIPAESSMQSPGWGSEPTQFPAWSVESKPAGQ